MTYSTIATISQVVSLLMFIAMFIAVLIYALRPSNGSRFDAIQRRSLDLDRAETTSGDRHGQT
jgi:cbb3-type cytochrome oxidase subunit 3